MAYPEEYPTLDNTETVIVLGRLTEDAYYGGPGWLLPRGTAASMYANGTKHVVLGETIHRVVYNVGTTDTTGEIVFRSYVLCATVGRVA